MIDTSSPQTSTYTIQQPAKLTPKQKDLCAKLDEWHAQYGLRIPPSDMFRGALFAMKIENRSNPDWISQAANSLREILYPLWSKQIDVPKKKGESLKEYGSVRADKSISELGRMWGELSNLTHHGCNPKHNTDLSTFSATNFENLIKQFEQVVLTSLARQIDIHKEIDEILTTNFPTPKVAIAIPSK